MAKTARGLISYAKAQIGKPYWYGTFGQIATASLYQYNKGRLPSYYTAKDFVSQYGQRVHDCAGLIKGYLWSDSPTSVPKYLSGGYPDISADAMRQSCTETGDISTLPEIPGVLLFYPGHVGIYIGNGQAIEARGHAYGVQLTQVKSRSWKTWGKFKYLEYDTEDNSMEYIGKGKLSIYINTGKKTAAQVKAETGCTAVINGGLFNMSTFKPIAQLKANHVVYANENWGVNYGIGWTDKPFMTASITQFQNFIGCICMVRNGAPVKMNYPADMGSARERSAFGFFPDGRIWLYATKTQTTPEKLQQIALSKGVEAAIMLDGGASTQCVFPKGSITSSRKVHNLICVRETGNAVAPVCPYKEPMTNQKKGSKGEGVKWLQWCLNQYGYSLDVDGDFGSKTYNALVDFQKKHGLTADGICGPMTRAVLIHG